MKKLILATALLTLTSNIYAEGVSQECEHAQTEMIRYEDMRNTLMDKYLMEGGVMMDVFMRIALIQQRVEVYINETIKVCEGEIPDKELNVIKEYRDSLETETDS